jgi:hypothetical protein
MRSTGTVVKLLAGAAFLIGPRSPAQVQNPKQNSTLGSSASPPAQEAGQSSNLGMAAAVPVTVFTYQGRLSVDGAPLEVAKDFQFRLFDSLAGTTTIGSAIIKINVPVSHGLFVVELDFGENAFNGDARFLGVGVRTANSTDQFTPVTPRQQITPTPYAIHSVNADFATNAGFATTAGSITVPCPRRKYYMTKVTPQGNQVLTACVAGYHMASFAEIMDPSNLEYATDLVGAGQAHTLSDAGSGPPFSSLAFIRTGVSNSTNAVAGNANCTTWTTNLSTANGTVIALKPTWADSPTNVSPWDASVRACNNPSPSVHVWCVQD